MFGCDSLDVVVLVTAEPSAGFTLPFVRQVELVGRIFDSHAHSGRIAGGVAGGRRGYARLPGPAHTESVRLVHNGHVDIS